MNSRPRTILSRWRAIQSALCSFFGRLLSRKALAAASQMPSARNFQRLTSVRSRLGLGKSLLLGHAVDVFDDDPGIEKGVSSSSRRTGILPRG